MNDLTNKLGRPTLSKQQEIEQSVFEYFSHGISAYTAVKELGINCRTNKKWLKTKQSQIKFVNSIN